MITVCCAKVASFTDATDHYMYEKVSERSEGVLIFSLPLYNALNLPPVLDDRIDYFGELVKEYYNIEELGDPASVTDVSYLHPPPLTPFYVGAGRSRCGWPYYHRLRNQC